MACSASEALTRELASNWPSAGSRTLAEDLVLSTVRQVRFLRNLTQGIQSNQRAAATPAAGKRARAAEEAAEERPELQRRKVTPPATTHPSTAGKSKAGREPKDESEGLEEETEEEEESESEDKDIRPAGSGSRRPPEPPGPPPHLRGQSSGGRHSSKGDSSQKRAGRKHQRLGRLEDKPHLNVHRKLPAVELDTLSADKGRDSLHRLP